MQRSLRTDIMSPGSTTFRQVQVDVSTQADLVGYESEDERMGRRGRSKRGTLYSKEDIKEQYCINQKELLVLESGSPNALFGCLSKHHDSSCSKNSFLSVCMSRAPSDENLHDMQPLPRRPTDDLERAYMRRRPITICGADPTRYAWIPEDEEPMKLEHARPIQPERELLNRPVTSYSSEHIPGSCPAHYLPPPPPPPVGSNRTKHVSFARSHTLTSFDDAIMELKRTPSGIYKSQERLIDTKKEFCFPNYIISSEKVMKKTPMKTQATQTEPNGREPPHYLSLSPRTVHRVRMVSQGAQTNGQLWNGRRLMKSYSEAGYQHFGTGEPVEKDIAKDHDILTRTQSEEPRSPYMQPPQLPWPVPDTSIAPCMTTLPRTHDRKKIKPERAYKEIFIDFEPAPSEKRPKKHIDVIDANILVDRVDGVKVSLSSFSTEEEVMEEMVAMEKRPSFTRTQDSVDEEFHENLVYGGIFQKHSSSQHAIDKVLHDEIDPRKGKSEASSPERRDGPLMATLTISRRASPFASSDSLTTRADHSDGIWNESQSTVLQAESDNGVWEGKPPSKKQQLLLQHQQRSSIDTDALDDDTHQSPIFSPMRHESTVPFVTIATVHQHDSSAATLAGVGKGSISSLDFKGSTRSSLSPCLRDGRRKSTKSPDKEEEVISGRHDSGKVTDISESTTEDYATAHDNSGTDTSSKKSTKIPQTGSKEEGSFESASSTHSFTRDDTVQTVPCSPPPIVEENMSDVVAEVEELPRVERKISESKDDKDDESGNIESSSSGSYSVESGQRESGETRGEWTDQERHLVKKGLKLDLSDHSNEPEGWSDKDFEEKSDKKIQPKISPKTGPGKLPAGPSKRNQQGPPKKWVHKGNGEITPGMVRSPAMPEGFRAEEWAPPQRTTPSHTPDEVSVKNEPEASSDESSCEQKVTGIEETINGHSPRRRRTRGGRSRRTQRPLAPAPVSAQQLSPSTTKFVKSPSPRGSPRKTVKGTKIHEHRKTAISPETGTGAGQLKALSAESLRSVSPGSDSVFYNEADTHLLCHQCGREVENYPTEEGVEEIVQPPADFADSPGNTKVKTHRLYKKQEKRFRSEERGGDRRRHSRFKTDGLRAKSEERGKERGIKTKLRPHARSTDASMEHLRTGDSSPSISEALVDDEPRVYADSFKKSMWLRIPDPDQIQEWNKSLESDDIITPPEVRRKPSIDSTGSEKEFKRKYLAATHRMVHRKSSMEMYRRLQSKSFECDKKLIVKRKAGEFGFRIHGSRPIVVSAIEPETPAETSGLEVGDIVLSVNGISVLEASHSEVVKLAHAGSDTLELEVARTCDTLTPVTKESEKVQCSGFLFKLGVDGRWVQRWFALKGDDCLYYFKSPEETQPLGALMLSNYNISLTPDSGRAYSFVLAKTGCKSLELAADTEEILERWRSYLQRAVVCDKNSKHQWLEKSCMMIQQPASAVPQPDCFGHLTQLEDKWRRRYCVLKDAALLLYADSSAQKALAVACLQGYRVQSSGTSNKRFSFEVIPPESKQKHFYFYTDTEMDKKRWIAAIEYSIDRWVRVG